MRVERFNVGPLDNNTYLLVDEDSGDTALIDPSFDSRPVWNEIQSNGWKVTWLLNTHAHIDHVVENVYFAEKTHAPVAMHPLDLPLLHAMNMQAKWMDCPPPPVMEPTRLLADNEEIQIGVQTVKVILTPGHSPGSVSFVGDGFVICGDALFAGSIGRTDLPGGNHDQLITAIKTRLLTLPDDTIVYPGHGDTSTIGIEKRTNPYVQE